MTISLELGVMKQNEIRRIMNHVFSTINCPHCGEDEIYRGKTEINLNSTLGLIFHIECPECKTVMKVNGFLPGKIRTNKGIKKQINTKNIEQAVEKIKGFRGNLVDLFNE